MNTHMFNLVNELGKKYGVLRYTTLTLINLSLLYMDLASKASLPAETRQAQVMPLKDAFSPEIIPFLEEMGKHLISFGGSF